MRRWLVSGVLATALLQGLPTPSWAADEHEGGFAGGGLMPDGAEVIVGDGTSAVGVDSTTGSGGSLRCRWFVAWFGGISEMPSSTEANGSFDLTGEGWGLLSDPETYEPGQRATLLHQCASLETGEQVLSEYVEVALPLASPPVVSIDELVELARREIRLPLPSPATSPAGEQVVHLPTWLWVENWVPVTATASAGSVSAVVTASPVEQIWDFAGEVTSCTGPGTAYDLSLKPEAQAPSCVHRFTRPSSGVPTSVTVVWEIAWSASTGQGGVLGTIPRSVDLTLPVVEVQALNS